MPGEEGKVGEVAGGRRPHERGPPLHVLQVCQRPLHEHAHSLRVTCIPLSRLCLIRENVMKEGNFAENFVILLIWDFLEVGT
jgi:hypothetical protein